MGKEHGTAPIWVVVLGWVLFAVVLVLAFGISTHDGRNDLNCRGFFGVSGPVAEVGPADEDKLDHDGDGIGCEGMTWD
jgi:hypothetical protein